MLHVRRSGANGLEDDILHACLSCLVHDPQMENTRGSWMFKLLKRASCLEAFREPILAKLKTATPETVPYWDACQLMALAHCYVDEGSRQAYQVIYQKFGEQLYDPTVGGHQIVMLDGLSGFVHVAEVVGARLRREADFRDEGYLLWLADDEFGEEQVARVLRERSPTSPNVAAFEYMVEQQRARSAKGRHTRHSPTLAEFLAAAEDEEEVPWQIWRRFARNATGEELGEVLSRVLRETDRNRLANFLQVFCVAKLLRLDDRLFEWAQAADETLRDRALAALAQVEAPGIRELGLRLLEDQDLARRRGGIELLHTNHHTEDLPRIAAALPSEGPPAVLHGMSTKLMMISDRQPQDVELARWVYEYNPCSFCRNGAFRRLRKRNALTKFQLAECVWDGYDETRASARRTIRNRRRERGESS